MTYDSEVLADSPVTYYKLDDLTGADSSGNGNSAFLTNATLVGSGAFASSSNSVQLGSAPNTATGYIDVVGFAPGTGAFTVEAWVKVLLDLSASFGRGSMIYAEEGSIWEFRLRFDDAFQYGSPTFRMIYGGGADAGHYEPFPNDHAWHHVVLTYSGSGTLKFYIDGSLVNTTSHSGWDFDAANGSVIGGNTNPSSADCRGSVDNVAFYHSELSAARISAHFAASGGGAGGSTNAPAARATGAGTAYQAFAGTAYAAAGVATGTGTAYAAAGFSPPANAVAEVATGTGSAHNPLVLVSQPDYLVHDRLKTNLPNGSSWTGTTWQAALFLRQTWAPTASDAVIATATLAGATEVASSGYSRQTLGSKTATYDTSLDAGRADAADVTFPITGVSTFDTIVMFAQVNDDSDSWLAITWPLPSAVSVTGAVSVKFDPLGVFEVT